MKSPNSTNLPSPPKKNFFQYFYLTDIYSKSHWSGKNLNLKMKMFMET